MLFVAQPSPVFRLGMMTTTPAAEQQDLATFFTLTAVPSIPKWHRKWRFSFILATTQNNNTKKERNMKELEKKEQRNTLGKAHKIKKKNINSSICENKIALAISSSSSTPTPIFRHSAALFHLGNTKSFHSHPLSSAPGSTVGWSHETSSFSSIVFFCRLFLIFPTLRAADVVSSTWRFHHHIRYGVRVRERMSKYLASFAVLLVWDGLPEF